MIWKVEDLVKGQHHPGDSSSLAILHVKGNIGESDDTGRVLWKFLKTPDADGVVCDPWLLRVVQRTMVVQFIDDRALLGSTKFAAWDEQSTFKRLRSKSLRCEVIS